MGRATDPGENHDPGNDDQHFAEGLDPGAPIREQALVSLMVIVILLDMRNG